MHTSVCRHPTCWYVVQVKQVYFFAEDDAVIVTEGEHPNSKNSTENGHEVIRTVLLGSRSSGKIQLIEGFFGTDCLAPTVDEGWVNL